jgi:hypothetical protein
VPVRNPALPGNDSLAVGEESEQRALLDESAAGSSPECGKPMTMKVYASISHAVRPTMPQVLIAPRGTRPGTQGARFGTYFRPQIVRIRLD